MNVKAAVAQLRIIKECAEDAGLFEHTFLGYGTCLGKVRENGCIPHDDDTDVCILADRTTKEQEEKFHQNCDAAGLFDRRHRIERRQDTGRFVWFSLKGSKSALKMVDGYRDGCKSCVWFQQSWNKFYWHSKGRRWVKKLGPRYNIGRFGAEGIMKGIPQFLFNKLVTVDFYGMEWRIPAQYGTVLDFWYPNWAFPKKGGASAAEHYCIVPKWSDSKNWKMV